MYINGDINRHDHSLIWNSYQKYPLYDQVSMETSLVVAQTDKKSIYDGYELILIG